MWTCVQCGEQIDETFGACWSCNAVAPTPATGVTTATPEEIPFRNKKSSKKKLHASALDQFESRDAKTENVVNLLEMYLQPREGLQHWACGEKRSAATFILMALSFAVCPFLGYGLTAEPAMNSFLGWLATGVIWYLFWPEVVKTYVIGLTGERLIVIRYKRRVEPSRVITVFDYWLERLPPSEYHRRPTRVDISIADSVQPFAASFFQLALKDNLAGAEAIGRILRKINPPRSRGAASYCPGCKSEFREGVDLCNTCHVSLVPFPFSASG